MLFSLAPSVFVSFVFAHTERVAMTPAVERSFGKRLSEFFNILKELFLWVFGMGDTRFSIW